MFSRVMTPLYLFVFFFSLAFAGELKVKKFDLNKNGKIDRTEYFDKEKLVKVEIDKNNDLKIDHKIIYSAGKIFETHYYDDNNNGYFSKKVTFELDPKDKSKIIKRVYLDKNNDSRYEVSFKETLSRHQKKDSVFCQYEIGKFDKEQFLIDALKVTAKVENGFIPTGFGYQVDQGCVERWGTQFLADLKETKEKGMACLKGLYEKSASKNITGALSNYFELEKLQKTQKIKIVCSENEGFDWDGIDGHASTGDESDSIEKPKAQHPYISLNPNSPASRPITVEQREELQRTLFHEGFHNLGQRHGSGFEFAYPCEVCCFPKGTDDEGEEQRQLSCKLCLGDYKSASSKEYVSDLIDWSHNEYREYVGSGAARNFIKENPKSTDALIMLAKAESSNFNPVGSELVDIALKKELLTGSDNIILATIISENKNYLNEDEKKAAVAIAESMFYSYYETDAQKAIDVLEKNKDVLKKMYQKSLEQGYEFEKLRAQDMYKPLDKLIYDNWINGYPNPSEEMRTKFYNLVTYIEEDK